MPTLEDLTADFEALDALLDESGGELTPAVEAFFDELQRNLQEKADGFAYYIRFLEARAKLCNAEAKRFGERATTAEKRARWLKGRMMGFMQLRDMPRIETAKNTLAIQANGGILPLIIEDESALPAACRKVLTMPDNDAIRARLEAGRKVPGARLGERGSSLRIR